jgi:acyl-[acyl-carrier-protein]-phospholipid O-acyltransferase / long-chain-fatty-acid--[acyl-carrier-protein] ligase
LSVSTSTGFSSFLFGGEVLLEISRMSRPRARRELLVFLSDSLVRAFVWLITRLFYPLHARGLENVPRRSGALLISNHVSFVDWLLLTAAAKRPVRFLISKEFCDSPWLGPIVRVARVIPIPPGVRPREVTHALQCCGDVIRNGEIVCVFAEGGITRTGELRQFQRGFERIMKNVDAPIVPVALTGVWGSIFSFERGKFFWKRPRQFMRPVTVSFGSPLAPRATPEEVQQAVRKLANSD